MTLPPNPLAATPPLTYGFKETGKQALAAGTATDGSRNPRIKLTNTSGDAADLHGALGTGVSGAAGDRALDNTLNYGILSASGARHEADFDAIDNLGGFRLRGGPVADSGTLELRVSCDFLVESSAVNDEIGEFVNFPVTYNCGLTSNNVQFLKGITQSPLNLLSSLRWFGPLPLSGRGGYG